jgi:hypothetical protein
MATISLDRIRQDIEAKYAPVVIDLGGGVSCTLTQAMRLPKAVRVELVNSQKAVNAREDDETYDEDRVLGHLRQIIRLVATNPDDAESLIAAIGDDVAVLGEVVRAYGEGSQLPEA